MQNLQFEKRSQNICQKWFIIIYSTISITPCSKKLIHGNIFCNYFFLKKTKTKNELDAFMIIKYFYTIGMLEAFL